MNAPESPALPDAWIIRTDGTIERTSVAHLTTTGTIRDYIPLSTRQHGLRAFNVSLEADSHYVNEDAPRLLGMPNVTGVFGAILLIQTTNPKQPLDKRVAAALGGDPTAMQEFNLSMGA